MRSPDPELTTAWQKIDDPLAYFNFSVNVMKPNYGAGMGLIYRRCYRPVTVLLCCVVKDLNDPGSGGCGLAIRQERQVRCRALSRVKLGCISRLFLILTLPLFGSER